MFKSGLRFEHCRPNTVHLNFLQTQWAESADCHYTGCCVPSDLRSEPPALQLFSVPERSPALAQGTGSFGAPAKSFARDLARRRLEWSTACCQTALGYHLWSAAGKRLYGKGVCRDRPPS